MKDFYANKTVEIINNIHYATLATVSLNGDPFNAPVFVAYDKNLSLYWSSSAQSQHSQNIANNGKVYIVIYDSTVAQGTGWGVYIQAEAAAVTDSAEADKALTLLGNRRDKLFNKNGSEMIEGTHKIYKAKPINFWINDAKQDLNGEYIEDYRVRIDLSKILEQGVRDL